MPRLPDETALPKVRGGGSSPDIRVPGLAWNVLDAGASAQAKGLQAIGDGIGAAAKGFGAYIQDQASQDDFDTKKKLLDFKLDTEMALEEHKRSMPTGGNGFSSGWQAEYERRAREFVGDKDGNIPKSMRNQVGLALKQHEVALSERAQRYEWGERDKATIEGLNATLGQVRSFVEADPGRKDEKHAEGIGLIDAAPIQPADKHRLRQSFAKEMDKTAIISRGMKIGSAEDREALRKDLGPDMPDRRAVPLHSGPIREIDRTSEGLGSRDPIKPKGIVFHYTGGSTSASAVTTLRQRGLAYNYLVDKDGTVHTLVPGGQRAAHMMNADRGDLTNANTIGIAYVGRGEDDITPEQRAVGRALASRDAKKFGIDQSQVFGHGEVNSHKEGREGATDARHIRERGFDAEGEVAAGSGAKPVAQRGLVHAAGLKEPQEPQTYVGPYASLTLSERKALWGQVETEWRKKIGDIGQTIKEHIAKSAMTLPPQPVLDNLTAQVKAINDPKLSAEFAKLVTTVEWTSKWRQAPPQATEAYARNLRSFANEHGETPELTEQLKRAEALVETQTNEVKADAMSWAHKVGISVPLPVNEADAALDPGPSAGYSSAGMASARPAPVAKVELETMGDFRRPDLGAVLSRRMRQAKGVGIYYNQPPQVFTEVERKQITSTIKNGGDGLLHTMGHIVTAAQMNDIDPALVLREITRDAPELAIMGELYANGGKTPLLETAAAAMKWKVSMGERFESTIDKAQAKPDLGEYAEVLSKTQTRVDHVKALANLVYEWTTRDKGLKQFDAETYRGVVAKIMGETVGPDGTKYGGVGEQNRSWFDFRGATSVLVPAGVRQDRFDEMVEAIRADDLLTVGVPRTASGAPLTMTEVRRATWVSLGPGLYALQMGTKDGKPQFAYSDEGKPYAMDVRAILPRIRQRRPAIFAGFNPMLDAVPAMPSDPEYPTAWGLPKTSVTPPASAPSEPVSP